MGSDSINDKYWIPPRLLLLDFHGKCVYASNRPDIPFLQFHWIGRFARMNKQEVKIVFEFIVEIIAFFILTFSMALLWKFNTVLFCLYLVLVPLFFLKGFNTSDKILFISAALLFQVGEIILTKYGTWTYSNTSYLNIPIWLPLAWGFCAVIIKRFASTIDEFTKYYGQRISQVLTNVSKAEFDETPIIRVTPPVSARFKKYLAVILK